MRPESGRYIPWSYPDFMFLMAATTWVEDEAQIDELVPVTDTKDRQLGREEHRRRLWPLRRGAFEHVEGHEAVAPVELLRSTLRVEHQSDTPKLGHHALGQLDGKPQECPPETAPAGGRFHRQAGDPEDRHRIGRGLPAGREIGGIQ